MPQRRKREFDPSWQGQMRDALPESTDEAIDAPYRPRHTGFDEATTRNAQATADRAKEGAGARGEDANREYVDEGPAEAERRRRAMGR